MNCLDCRREILAHPNRMDAAAVAHVASCEACRSFATETVRIDGKIADAIKVPVPDDLAGRVLRTSAHGGGARRSLLALAASLLLALAVGTGWWLARDDPFARAGIDFVVDKEVGAILTAKPADPGVLARVTQALRVQLPTRPSEVRYIGTCPFGGTIAHHVVVITPEGKATLLLFPEKRIRNAGGASARGLRSIAKPAGIGSVIIVGSTQAVHRLADIVTRS